MTVDAIDVYWRPGCPFCMMLRRKIDAHGLPVREVNIWDDPEAAARVREVADGNETVPTVFVGEHALVNPGMDELLRAIEQHAPDIEIPERRSVWQRLRGR